MELVSRTSLVKTNEGAIDTTVVQLSINISLVIPMPVC
jgi:hypothetical protein